MHSRGHLLTLGALLSAAAVASAQPAEPPRAAALFRGHFRRGFEHTTFVPCPGSGVPAVLEAIRADSAWYLPAAVWVPSWGNDRRGTVRYPEVPRRPGHPHEWFVVWRGTFSAPGRYGHGGIARFEFAVDSVLEARAPRSSDCASDVRPAP